jgi:malate dehydrogenase (oxaloacetate-decarboxylating)
MSGLQPFQNAFARPREDVATWAVKSKAHIDLADVVANAAPTLLIGTSGQAHAFSEDVVRAMAARVPRPIIFPFSNPTERCEAAPADLLAWTEGRAVIGTGSPFPPVTRDGKLFRIDQTNNAYVYPGIGLGVIAVEARAISEGMFLAAARTVADLSPAKRDPHANLLPPLGELRDVSQQVAIAVAKKAVSEGLTSLDRMEDVAGRIREKIWEPAYAPYRRLRKTSGN